MISVAVVEDSAGIRKSLKLLLDESPGFKCACACDSAEEALRLIPRNPPDVVLMDIHLPNVSGIECTFRLKAMLPKLLILMITVYADTDSIFNALRAGASGYLLKRSSPDKILEAIADVYNGGAPMTSEIARKVVEVFNSPAPTENLNESLTRREIEILEQLSRGFANKEIAQKLNISVDTTRWHLKQIYEKIHVRSRTEAVVKFLSGREAATALKTPASIK